MAIKVIRVKYLTKERFDEALQSCRHVLTYKVLFSKCKKTCLIVNDGNKSHVIMSLAVFSVKMKTVMKL